jgi:hypothetical protein
VNKYVLAAALALSFGGAAQAAAIDPTQQAPSRPEAAQQPAAGASADSRIQLFALPLSELPEPEVFAMMLVGLVLIGYRASRDSSEKFE